MSGILQSRLSAKQREKEEEQKPEGIADDQNYGWDEDENRREDEEYNLSEEDISQLNDIDEMMADETFEAESKRKRKLRKLSQVILTAACTYMVILIYGSIITEYYYDSKGVLEPVVMSVTDISNKNEYTSLIGMYLQTRSLYETILTLDYRMASGVEDTMAIAPEYEETLDTVSTLTTQIDAAVISSKYTQVKNMLLTWVKTHSAAYCQYMSSAIAQNDSNAAAEAIAARQVLNDNFQLITQNIITLGEDIKGYDLTDIKNWSPDNYVKETIEGIKGETGDD